jgi:carbon monoxide dehydrogenase subunit G
MKVKIDSKNRKIILTASGKERKVINLIVAFAGGSVKNVSKSLIDRIANSFINTIVIDMDQENITKEFIQLLLRIK